MMDATEMQKGDVLVSKTAHGVYLIRRFSGIGEEIVPDVDYDPTNSQPVESAVAKAAGLACRDKVDLWFTDDGLSIKCLERFRISN